MVVIAIISLLAAILFPVFAAARAKARQTTCVSNLRELGLAAQQYVQDYDGLLPYALDPADLAVTTIWATQPAACYAAVTQMKAAGQALAWHQMPYGSGPWVPGVLDTYVKSRDLWHCPSDTGFDYIDNNDSCGGPCAMSARPTMFDSQGASYFYHTSLAVAERSVDTLSGTTILTGKPVGPAQVLLLFDGAGSWHGDPWKPGQPRGGLRYVTLFIDGHAKLLTYTDYLDSWNINFTGGSGSGPCP